MVSEETVDAIAALLAGQANGDTESLLRSRFPGMRLTFCSTDDITVRRPVRTTPNYELYLFGGDHCLTLSNDFDAAHGVVVAQVEE